MRHQASVTSVSWIPSEAVPGLLRVTFDLGVSHYDQPLPDRISPGLLEELRRDDRFRFANQLSAWIEVEGGKIVRHGYSGRGHMGRTRLRMGPASITFAGVSYPDIQAPPVVGPSWVRFVQTAGGRTGAPTPHVALRWPPVGVAMPLVWTTLALTMHADGRAEYEVLGASPFPRHWIYDTDGKLAHKVGVAAFRTWMRVARPRRSPWSGHDMSALVTDAESAVERRLSGAIMGADQPEIRRERAGSCLVREGDEASEVFLVLDGIMDVEVGGKVVGRVGPGMIVGERGVLESGRRTATLRAVTDVRIAVTRPESLPERELAEVAAGHRQEEAPS